VLFYVFHRLFNPKELNMLISGDGEGGSGGVDVEDLRQYVRYSGGYSEESTTVKLFWKVKILRQVVEAADLRCINHKTCFVLLFQSGS
jgi:hypothetical protein